LIVQYLEKKPGPDAGAGEKAEGESVAGAAEKAGKEAGEKKKE
jgi:hypothetical protein